MSLHESHISKISKLYLLATNFLFLSCVSSLHLKCHLSVLRLIFLFDCHHHRTTISLNYVLLYMLVMQAYFEFTSLFDKQLFIEPWSAFL